MLVNQNNRTAPATRLTVWDLCILVLAVLCALVLLFFPRGEAGQVCIVSWDGGEVTLPLAEPDTLTLESGGVCLTIVVENGGVYVGKTAVVTITTSLQTNAGRIIFGRILEE